MIGGKENILSAILTAAGGTSSPRHGEREILAALVVALGGATISAHSSSTNQLIAAAVNAATDSGGGGSTPEWVPANAKIYIDLVNDRAWTEADGEVAIDTLLGSDANTENGWGATSYDAANLTADGYVPTTQVAFIGSARTLMLASSTIVVREKVVSDDNSRASAFAVLAADGNDALEFDIGHGAVVGVRGESYGGNYGTDFEGTSNGYLGINQLALTLAGTRAEFACNGSAATASTLLDADRPSANPLVASLYGGATVALQSITIYDALPSTSGLSALSETGVTNTAPTAIIATKVDDGTIVDGGTITVASGPPAAVAHYPIVTLSVADDEGNPCAITIVGGADAALFDFGFFNLPDALVAVNDLSGGTYSVTLRATDPGGLYVEQQFTITVTA